MINKIDLLENVNHCRASQTILWASRSIHDEDNRNWNNVTKCGGYQRDGMLSLVPHEDMKD